MTWIGVAVLGAFGAYARFFVDGLVSARTGRMWPYGTLVVNLSGAFILGVFAGATLDSTAYRLAGTATIGAYTTFSTWMFETQRLTEERQVAHATQNVVVSLAVGVAVAAAGLWIGGRL